MPHFGVDPRSRGFRANHDESARHFQLFTEPVPEVHGCGQFRPIAKNGCQARGGVRMFGEKGLRNLKRLQPQLKPGREGFVA